jgi:hypothetical protein
VLPTRTVRRWLDQLGTNDSHKSHNVQVICHDQSGSGLIASPADERLLRELLEPGIVGPVDCSYSMLAEGDLVAVLAVANQHNGQNTSHWVQLFRLANGAVLETWVSGSVRDVDRGPLPDEPHGRLGAEDANKRTVQRWRDEMYGEQRFEKLVAELAGPEYVRHEATGSWTTTIEQHLLRVQRLYRPKETHRPLRITYGLVAEGDRVAGWGRCAATVAVIPGTTASTVLSRCSASRTLDW